MTKGKRCGSGALVAFDVCTSQYAVCISRTGTCLVAMPGEGEPECSDMASSYPTKACECSLNASPMSFVILIIKS